MRIRFHLEARYYVAAIPFFGIRFGVTALLVDFAQNVSLPAVGLSVNFGFQNVNLLSKYIT